MFLALTLCMTAFLGVASAWAISYTSAASGNWNATTTWTPAGVPGANDEVMILAAHVVTLTQDQECDSLNVPNTASRLLGPFTLSVHGMLNCIATLTLDNIIVGPRIKFVGGTRTLYGANWAGNGTSLVVEVALDPGATGSFTGNLKAKRWLINGGTLNVTGSVRADSGAANTGTITIGNTGALSLSSTVTRTSTASSPYGTLAVTGNGVLRTTSTSGAVFGVPTVFTCDPSSIVEYAGAGQTIQTPTSGGYGNLLTSGTGNKTLGSSTSVNGGASTIGSTTTLVVGANTLTVNGGMTVSSALALGATGTITVGSGGNLALGAALTNAGALNVNGTLQLNAGGSVSAAPTYGGSSTLVYNNPAGATVASEWGTGGSAGIGVPQNVTVQAGTLTGASSARTVPGALTLAGGAMTLASGGDVAVNGTLALGSANITTGSAKVALPAAASLTRSTGYVLGNLQKGVTSGTLARTFEIGDAAGYAPVNVNFASVSSAGDLAASTALIGAAPPVASQLSPSQYVNRSWTLTNSGTAFSTYDATFNFNGAEKVGSPNTNSLLVAKNTGGTWSLPAVGARNSTSTQATGLSAFSDFYLGEAASFTISASAGANGSISPSGAVSVSNGGNLSFTITPNTGYHVADLLVDGSSVGAQTSYTFTGVTAAHTIAASFAIDTFTLTASAGANGSIAPSGVTTVNYGGGQAYTITPAANYVIADVLVDGASVGAVPTYTFSSVIANHTITASFAPVPPTALISAVSPTGTLSTTTTSLTVPVTLSRTFNTSNLGFSIHIHLSSNLALSGGTSGITEGDYLASGGGTTTFMVHDNGGGNYTIDDVTLGTPCGTAALSGTLFNVAVTSTPTASPGSVTITSVDLRDCDNQVIGSSIGSAATVDIDNTPPVATLATPNGGETWIVGATHAITWTASDNRAVTTVDLAYSTDGGVTYANSIATGLANSGTYDWTIPSSITSQARVRVTAHDAAGNSGSDASDADFTIGQYAITASASAHGSIAPNGVTNVDFNGSQAYTITPAAHYHVADVLVDGVSVGAVTSYTFSNVTADHTIAASFAIDTYTITASAGANGSIAPNGVTNVDFDGSQAYTITPAAGYHVLDVLVDGVSVGAVTTYTFANVAANHTIAASFAIDVFTITASAGANGSIAPNGVTNVDFDGSQAYTITPAAGYHVLDVLVDGASVGAVTTYTFSNVTANHTIAASFAIDVFTITASAGANGNIAPNGVTNVDFNGSQAYTITPAAHYHVADVLVDGASVGAVTTYTFSNVTANHTIAASFAVDTYTITASAGANGTIAPNGVTTVDFDGSQAYTITPATGYHVADVLVDGASVGAVTTYTFSNVTANHTVAASFAIDVFTITASAGANGSIAPNGVTNVDFGGGQAYTITPAAGYHVLDVLVDGVSVGAVTTYTFSNVTANHTIAASFSIDVFSITASAGANGSIAPNGETNVNSGGSQAYTITPASGYHVADVLVDGASVGAVTTYSFSNVTANHTIAASFAIDVFTITASAGANGNIAPNGVTNVDFNGSQAYTITPAAHYHVADVLVDGASVGAVTTYTFSNVTANHTIAASFAIDNYTITASAGANGSIAPNGATNVDFGGSQAYTISPANGYHIADVQVDGVSVGAVTTYTFSNVTANHTIAASFAIDVFTITASAGANGSIAPNGGTNVDFGGSQAYTITPATGYHVADVLVDGASVGAVTTYTFSNVTANHTIAASFAIDTHTITASAVGHGSVNPSGLVSVVYGADQAFTITPDAGYHVGTLVIDGAGQAVVPGVMTYTFTNVTADHTLTATFVQNPPVAAIATLVATQVKSGNDTDGTTKMAVNWTPTPAGTTVQVYRAAFGNYPRYDNAPGSGSVPAAPSYPPSAAWTLTGVTAPGEADEVASRDYFYFAAFVTDAYGTVSAVSNVTTGTLDYHLGDVSNGLVAGQGDNAVTVTDLSLLGAHYGLSGPAASAFSYLDVGPTLDFSPDTRPTTDGVIDFEDLVMFAMNYNLVSSPQDAGTPVAAALKDEVTVEVPDTKLGDLTVRLLLHGTGSVHGLSTKLSWDPEVVEPVSFAPGVLLDQEQSVALSGQPGVLDVARLGAGRTGLVGEGEIATVTFRRLAIGDGRVAIAGVTARDARNHPIAMAFGTEQHPVIPAITSFDRIAPNPFRSNASLVFSLAKSGPVELAIYSVDGRRVRTLTRETKAAGVYSIAWDGHDDGGRGINAGIYFARLVTGQGRFTHSLVYLK